MIRPDNEFTSERVLLELLDEVIDSQKFLTRGAVVHFHLAVRPAGVGDHAFLPSLDLRQHGSNGVVARIAVQDVSFFIRRHREHRRRRKSSPKFFESMLILRRSDKGDILAN